MNFDLTPNEKIEYIVKNIPKDIHYEITEAFTEFVDTYYQNSKKLCENEKDLGKYFYIFMQFPHCHM
jgi:hypothetical protein